jgi:hypothetical protein
MVIGDWRLVQNVGLARTVVGRHTFWWHVKPNTNTGNVLKSSNLNTPIHRVLVMVAFGKWSEMAL